MGTKQIKLTEEEKKDAQLNLEDSTLTISATEFSIKQQEEAIEKRLPARMAIRHARDQVGKMKHELEKVKLNKTFFEKLVRTGVREEQVYDAIGDKPEESEESETPESEKESEAPKEPKEE